MLFSPLFCQEADNLITQEELSEQRAEILRIMSSNPDRRKKEEALNAIIRLIENGVITSEDTVFIDIISLLAESGDVAKNFDEYGYVNNDFSLIRIKACQLLETVGGGYARAGLLRVVNQDKESIVVQQAINSLVNAFPDADSFTVGLFTKTFLKFNKRFPDNSLAYTYLKAMDAYITANRKLLNPRIIYTLDRIANEDSGYLPDIREYAHSLSLKFLF